MRKFSVGLVFFLSVCMVFAFTTADVDAADTIKIGFNIPLTGDNPDVGASSKNAAQMYLKKNPTVTVGGKSYALKFFYDDNEYKAESAVKVSTKLITDEGVLGIIPGSMGAAGYVARGRGNPGSLCSAAHGAGRRMSRKAAINRYRWADARQILERMGVEVISAGLDEVPMAYKDIGEVMVAEGLISAAQRAGVLPTLEAVYRDPQIARSPLLGRNLTAPSAPTS